MKLAHSFYYVVETRKWLSHHLRAIVVGLPLAVGLLGLLSSLIQIRGGNGSEFVAALTEVAVRWSVYWFQYLADWRALLFGLAIVILIIEVIYQSNEKRLRTLMLHRKEQIDARLRTINPPDGHYLALIIGRMGEKALRIRRKRAKDIMESINKNIKKDEEVYWISLEEIGILMYEAKGKEPEYFLNVIFYVKLPLQLDSEDDATVFAKDITFAMVKPHPGDKLEDIEFAARDALKQTAFCLNDIRTKTGASGVVSLPPPCK